MTDLFKINNPLETTKCDCLLVRGKPRPVIDQPTVYLQPSIADNMLVGQCSRCKKIHAKKVVV